MDQKVFLSYKSIHKTAKKISDKIRASDFKPDLMVAIGTGGFIPARMLKTFLSIPILTVSISYYTDEDKPKAFPEKVQWIDEADNRLKGKKILLVDEVDDSRITLEYCLKELLKHEPEDIAVAVLHNKKKEKKGTIPSEIKHYYAGVDIDDNWICYPWDALDIDEHEKKAT